MDRSGKILLLLVGFVGLMDALDGTIVSVALPTIAADMNVDISMASWVSVAYFMMMAGLLILFGRIAQNVSIRFVLLTGIGLFSLSSLACALSVSFPMLIAARIAQGIGAAMMGATIPMCCVKFFSANELGYALAVVTIGYSVGAAMGPALGGVIVSALSWHWIFYINVPIGIVTIWLLNRRMPKEERQEEKVRADYVGALTLFIAIVGLVLLLENIGDSTMMIVSGIVCVLFLTAFIIHENRTDLPLLGLKVFRNVAFDFNLIVYFLINVVYMGLVYLLPFFMTITLGLDSTISGLFLFIPPIVTILTGMPIGRWSDATGRRWFCVASCLILALAMVLIAFMDGLNIPVYVLALGCMGLMWSFAGGPVISRVIESTVGETKEMGSTMCNEAAYLGSTIGAVFFAALFTVFAGADGIPIGSLSSEVFMDGFTASMIVGAVLALVGAVLSFVVKE